MKRFKYDVAVVGSGIGGLSAAALLSHWGYKTLVVEKLALIGGRCSSYEYKGFTLTTGALSVAVDGPIGDTFKEVGAELAVRPHPLYDYRIGGKDYPTSEKGGLRELIQIASEEGVAHRIMKALRRAIVWQEPIGSQSLKDWLMQYTDNKQVLGIFQGLVGTIHGMNLEELSAGEFIRYIKAMSGLRTIGLAYKGNKTLMEALAQAIKARGGEVWTKARAERILVDEEMTRGVVVRKDSAEIEISARAVISNVGPRKTVELAGKGNFNPAYLQKLEETLQPVGFILISLASRRPLLKKALGGVILTESRRVRLMMCPTLLCPELAPPGKHLLVAGGVFGSPPLDIEGEIKLNIQDLRDNLPGFDKEAELLMVGCFRDEWPLYHSAPGCDLPLKTPIENLYNVGDAVKPTGWVGLPACALSGRQVAEDIKARLKPEKA